MVAVSPDDSAAQSRASVRTSGARAPSEGGLRWFLLAGLILAVVELATNLPPIAIATMSDPSPTTAHTLTLVEDVADAALFVSIAFFALIVARSEASWVRVVALVVAFIWWRLGMPGRRRPSS